MFNSRSEAGPDRKTGGVGAYLALARFDHATKHVFIVPGMMLAYLLRGIHASSIELSITMGFLAAICIASANYVINEWLDRDFDKLHPTKSARAAVQHQLHKEYVLLEWAFFICLGLGSAYVASKAMLVTACLFALQGIVYNVPPIRTKDKAYLDVISESVNNPLRLMIGWSMIDPTTFPPSSIILAFWTGGAFLMAAKRLSELREIEATHGRDLLVRYRASFEGYSEISLTVSCMVYALFSSFFLAVFLVKYHIEYLLIVPVIIALFAQYMALSMQRGSSSAQKPEKLFRERGLIATVICLTAVFAVATVVKLPILEDLTSQQYISIPR